MKTPTVAVSHSTKYTVTAKHIANLVSDNQVQSLIDLIFVETEVKLTQEQASAVLCALPYSRLSNVFINLFRKAERTNFKSYQDLQKLNRSR